MTQKEMTEVLQKAADSLTPSREEMIVKVVALTVIGLVGWRGIKALENKNSSERV